MKPDLARISFEQTRGRMERQITELAQYNSTPGEGVTRLVYTAEDKQAKDYVKGVMEEIGLEVLEDAVGNIFGRLKGQNADLPPVWSGSHLDAPLNSGMFDGIVGVMGAVEALRLIKESGMLVKRDLVAVIFASEEPTRFGVGCLGSRALTGKLTAEELHQLRDDWGMTLYEAMKEGGYEPDQLHETIIEKGKISAFVELHIEQGAVLESMQKEIGVVDVIAAPTEVQLTLTGEQRHAGSTPMSLRKDAMCCAAEIILSLEAWAKASPSTHTVATVGRLEAVPGASNVIPERVNLTIDSREVDPTLKMKFLETLDGLVSSICKKRGISYELNVKAHDLPVQANPFLVETLSGICTDLKLDYHVMASGAYHDSMLMANIAPYSMIFVPSRDGISHDRREWTDYEQIVKGVQVLTHGLYQLGNEEEII